MPYKYSAAQLRFLKQKHAREREEEKCCDCPGCDKCKGFVRNCTCDHDLQWLSLRNGTQEMDTGQSGRITSRRDDMGPQETPKHVDRAAFEEFGF